jgi:predicted nucleotidyltransferase
MTIATPKEVHDGLIMAGICGHWDESLNYFQEDQIVGCFLQGSQNYNLDTPESDIDTKLIVTPTFAQLGLNKAPVSTTHVRDNNEHIDFKDIRLYVQCFRKQNLNFLEILFTPFSILNPLYRNEWNRLVAAREEIAHMNPWKAVKTMKGIAENKYEHMKHPFPSKIETLEKYGYDPKELCHLVRVWDYMLRYIQGETYANCLIPDQNMRDFLIRIKQGAYSADVAEAIANFCLNETENIADSFCAKTVDQENGEAQELLEDVCLQIMKISMKKELNET